MVGFYTPVPSSAGGGHPAKTAAAAAATIIMRTDLRGSIPHWIFSKTAGPTGMHLLRTLQVRRKEGGRKKREGRVLR